MYHLYINTNWATIMALNAQYIDGVLTLTDLSEGGGALIRINRDGTCLLYEIPMYGGDERYHGAYTNPCLALDVAATWT